MVCVLNGLGLCGKLLAKMYLIDPLLCLSSWLLSQPCRDIAPLQGGLTGMEKEALGDDSCQYSHQQKAAYTQGFSTRPRAGKQQAMGNAWLTVLSTKKTQGMLFHYSGCFSFIHHYIITRDKQNTGRPTCENQIMPLIKSRAHLLWLWCICHS